MSNRRANAEPREDPTGVGAKAGKWRGQLLLGVLVVVVYGQTLFFSALRAWDDSKYAFTRRAVTDWFAASWEARFLTPDLGYPTAVPTFLYYLTHQLPTGRVVAAMHGLNVLCHLGAVLLFERLVCRWTKSRRLAFVAAGIWAVHPIVVESVAWITDLKIVLLGPAVFGALLLWESYLERPSWASAAGVLLLVIVAFGCHPIALGLPVVIGLRTWLVRKEKSLDWRVVAPMGAVGLITLLYLPLAVGGQRAHVGHATRGVDPYTAYTWIDALRRMCAAWGLQLAHLIYPMGLHPSYYPSDELMATWIPVGVAGILLGLAVMIWSWCVDRTAFWAFALGVVFYAPASGIEFLPRFTADTYMYLPAAGFILGGVVLCGRLLERSEARSSRWLKRTAAGGVIAGLALASFVQTHWWRDVETLYSYTIEESPESPKPYVILGTYYFNNQQVEKARQVFMEGWQEMYLGGVVPYTMLASLEQTGDPERALKFGLDLTRPEYPRSPPDDLGLHLMRLIVRYRLALPSQRPYGRLLDRQVRQALGRPADDWDIDVLIRAARHFSSQHRDQLARLFLQKALDKEPQNCRVWRLVPRIAGTSFLEDSTIPSGCELERDEIRRQAR